MKNSFKFFLWLSLFLFFVSVTSGVSQQTKPAQPSQESPPIAVQNVKGNIYEIKGGSGANTGFFIGEKEVLVIDAKMSAESTKQMIAEIKRLTSNPITYVVLTHSDGDHVNGLIGFPDVVKIIAHNQTRKDMEEAFKDAAQRAYLPHLTFSEKLNLYSGNKVINFIHFGPAHTSGDTVIYFPDEKVAFVGDLLFIGRDPLIHRPKGGNSFGLVKNLKAILELDADTFVHGHGDIASRSDVEGLIKSLEEKQAKIQALIKEGKSLEEIKKIFNVEDKPTPPGGRRFVSLVEVIYLELTEKK
jgi:glyoxylase-like metal-dependent hydrolase (beta-lactamase superfamily II)